MAISYNRHTGMAGTDMSCLRQHHVNITQQVYHTATSASIHFHAAVCLVYYRSRYALMVLVIPFWYIITVRSLQRYTPQVVMFDIRDKLVKNSTVLSVEGWVSVCMVYRPMDRKLFHCVCKWKLQYPQSHVRLVRGMPDNETIAYL